MHTLAFSPLERLEGILDVLEVIWQPVQVIFGLAEGGAGRLDPDLRRVQFQLGAAAADE